VLAIDVFQNLTLRLARRRATPRRISATPRCAPTSSAAARVVTLALPHALFVDRIARVDII